MTELTRFHQRVKRRCHRQRALKNLLTSVGITVPRAFNNGKEDPTNKLYCVETLQRLVDEFGADNVRLALRLLVETSEANARCLKPAAITALTMIVSRHAYGQLGLALFEAMDRIDVAEQLAFARSLRSAAIASAWHQDADILAGLLAGEFRRHLGDLG